MNSFRLAFVIFRRMSFYAIFVAAGMGFLLYVAGGFVRFSQHVRDSRRQLQMIDADLIAPKGSSVEHMRRLLKLELFGQPALIPSQLYTTLTTDTPEGLKLTPVLIWGRYKSSPVIAVDGKIQDILARVLPELYQLGDDGVVVGREAAEFYDLKAGDRIEVETAFGDTVEKQAVLKFTVKFVSDLGVWNRAILSHLDRIQLVIDKLRFKPEQIWNNLILSYIFATGPEKWLLETKQLIDKRTVAVDLRLRDEIPGLLRLAGADEKLEFEVLIFAGLAAVISLIAFLAIWFPILRRMAKRLKRSGYTSRSLAACFSWLAIFLLTIAAALSVLASYLHPIL